VAVVPAGAALKSRAKGFSSAMTGCDESLYGEAQVCAR
jgi:hypothetical protein